MKIDQVAIRPIDHVAAKALLNDLFGIQDDSWILDTVGGRGSVKQYPQPEAIQADLSFHHGIVDCKEFEILRYHDGHPNWMDNIRGPIVSHLGVHCTAEEMLHVSAVMAKHNCLLVQSLTTVTHTNQAVPKGRRWTYAIYNTRALLGCDLKFIIRLDI